MSIPELPDIAEAMRAARRPTSVWRTASTAAERPFRLRIGEVFALRTEPKMQCVNAQTLRQCRTCSTYLLGGFGCLWATSHVCEDVAQPLREQTAGRHAIPYSGTYRLEGTKLITRVDHTQHEGWIDTDRFDVTWSEGRGLLEEVRRFFFTGGSELARETVHIETAPMPNPNGYGNTIVGKTIWARMGAQDRGTSRGQLRRRAVRKAADQVMDLNYGRWRSSPVYWQQHG
jgi:hypothetical protein